MADNEDNKVCVKCELKQPISDFYERHYFSLREQIKKIRVDTRCKKCVISKSLKYQKDNKTKVNIKNKNYVMDKKNGRVPEIKTDSLVKQRTLIEQARKKKTSSIYYINNKDIIIKKITEYRLNRYKKDINYKLTVILRSRLRSSLKTNQKKGSAIRDLGCSVEFLKQYIEAKFQEGMTWDNWKLDGWHIDHIRPISSFDLTNREELLKACHYTNLQPLWAKENIRKSNKWKMM